MRPKHVDPSRIIRRLKEGLETVDEIAEDLQINRQTAGDLLNRLIAEGVAAREPRPTFWPHWDESRPTFRHHLTGADQ